MVEYTTVRVEELQAGDVIVPTDQDQALVVAAIADPIGLLRLVDLNDALSGAPLGRRALRLDHEVGLLPEPAALHVLVNRGDEARIAEVAGTEKSIDPGRFASWFALADVTLTHDEAWEHRVVPVAVDKLARPGWQTLRRASRRALRPARAVAPALP